MAASPEFYKPAAATAAALSSPCAEDHYHRYDDTSSCRTPTGSGISYLKEPTTCPPAPRKPLCKKRLFLFKQGDRDTEAEAEAEVRPPATATLISLRLDDLERIFRPHPNAADKRRRTASTCFLDATTS
jgi:hypothetical protein